jgi:hypothetical protein
MPRFKNANVRRRGEVYTRSGPVTMLLAECSGGRHSPYETRRIQEQMPKRYGKNEPDQEDQTNDTQAIL